VQVPFKGEFHDGGIRMAIGGRGDSHRACQAGIGVMERAGKLVISPARS
jgi:hypothetical protein